jgi:hypothetical protein
MENWKTMLHPNERYPFNLAGKPYIWVRVNGVLQTRPATVDGRMTPAALDRIADGK